VQKIELDSCWTRNRRYNKLHRRFACKSHMILHACNQPLIRDSFFPLLILLPGWRGEECHLQRQLDQRSNTVLFLLLWRRRRRRSFYKVAVVESAKTRQGKAQATRVVIYKDELHPNMSLPCGFLLGSKWGLIGHNLYKVCPKLTSRCPYRAFVRH
jgi:hypothetical protein